MRLTYVLLLAAATLLANTNALATEGDAEKRLLRSHKNHKKAASAAVAEEERGMFDFLKNADDLPMFERMKLQPSYKNHIFESWRTGGGTKEGARTFMASQGLSPNQIDEWLELWLQHFAAHRKANIK
uniref:RxLR effector protein n=1 Tax=Phytophthora sojae TaxID=67593 RepID=G1FR34_PHYSO|nr:Avh51 [Phytophthora sojae]